MSGGRCLHGDGRARQAAAIGFWRPRGIGRRIQFHDQSTRQGDEDLHIARFGHHGQLVGQPGIVQARQNAVGDFTGAKGDVADLDTVAMRCRRIDQMKRGLPALVIEPLARKGERRTPSGLEPHDIGEQAQRGRVGCGMEVEVIEAESSGSGFGHVGKSNS